MSSGLNICGPQIRRLRFQRGWSQPDLAAKCQLAGWDITRDIIANIELKRRSISDIELAILARVLQSPLREFYPRDHQKYLL